MSNWTSITIDDLKATGLGFVVDKAQTAATGATDPVAEAVAGAVARVRRALAGRQMDRDTTKVPNSLKPVTVRLALFTLFGRLQFPLSADQAEQRKADNSDLLRLSDNPKIPVELPDDSGGTAEMQRGPSSETVQPGNFGNSREDLYRL
jgi:hypothetical protein